MTAFLKLIPGWIYAVIAFLVLAFVIYEVVDTISTQATSIAKLQGEKDDLVTDNASLTKEIARINQDIADKAKINGEVATKTQENNQTFNELDQTLQSAIEERKALEAALAAQQAIQSPADNPNTIDIIPVSNKPVVTQALINAKAANNEMNLVWKAYCVGSTDVKCVKGKMP